MVEKTCHLKLKMNLKYLLLFKTCYLKYNDFWNEIEDILNVKFHNQPIYDKNQSKDI